MSDSPLLLLLFSLALAAQFVAPATFEPAGVDWRVVGGQPIGIQDAPFQVSVRLKKAEQKSYGSGHICGGVVISQRLVATAAHCCVASKDAYREAGDFVLVMGSTRVSSRESGTQQYNVQQLIVHSGYGNLQNDIALMFINGYIPWASAAVRALPLSTRPLSVGTMCTVTGWGTTAYDGAMSNTLLAGDVPVVGYESCSLAYPPSVPSSQVCAGYAQGGIDACNGDSGGPLQCNGLLAGIVSYGIKCAEPNIPGVYTNVSYYNGWILQQNSSLNYSHYSNGGRPMAATLGLAPYGLWLIMFAILVGASSF